MRLALALLLLTPALHAQWQVQQSNTTADLRGIHALGNGVAWASGSHGAVLHTTDNGTKWQVCAVPPGADLLDFRAVQAFDANTAIVMSSGKGGLSRLYKTADACKTWKLIATNPDKEGFWDAMQGKDPEMVYILGDSVEVQLRIWEWKDGWEGHELELSYQARGKAEPGEGSFAASNSVFQLVGTKQVDPMWKYALRWSSGTANAAFISLVKDESTATCEPCREIRERVPVPMSTGTTSGGVFSFAFRTDLTGVAVGGDYLKPQSSFKTAAFTLDGGESWIPSKNQPHGYRSAVAYVPESASWITIGPNGTDISHDDGRNWTALNPTSDESQHWNALSPPFVVGPHGRIGLLRQEELKP